MLIILADRIWKSFRDVFLYGVAGCSTTVLNFSLYWLGVNILHAPYIYANVLAYCIATIYAFFVIKVFVFKSHDYAGKNLLREFSQFVGARFFTGILDTGIMFIGVSLMLLNDNYVKIASLVITIAINFIVSKFWVFKRKC